MDPLKRAITDDSTLAVLKAFERLRMLDREMPAQVVSTFLYIASHDPCHKQAIEEDLCHSTAAASRNIDWLCGRQRLSKPGLELVEKYRDPSNGRRFLCRLTSKGQALVRDITEDLYGPIR